MIKAFNPNHVFSILLVNGKTFKPELYATIKQSKEFKKYKREALKKSEEEFESVFYDPEGNVIY